MSALICGSFAYDTIMVFNDHFKHHILPEQVHILNVSFLVPDMRREFGGCAGNIAYNLKMLGGDGKPVGTVGDDFAPYAKWMDECGISRDQVLEVPGSYTAQAYITTDKDDNQITAFHPGAMNQAHQIDVSKINGTTLGMVSPDGRQGMIEHAAQFAGTGVPFIFDPGQGMPMFDGDSLLAFSEQANWLAFNDYEAMLMQERTGKSLKQLALMVEAIILTRGGEGSEIITRDKVYTIPAAPVKAVVDPTGCGDAYRAGILYGLMNDIDWETTGRIAALMGAIKIEQAGTQNHFVSPEEFGHRFEKAFDYKFD
ncbi:MAG: carbohydrate kinase family protein [gamma proteobacterium symbiont of Ctena orbiculata]|nr:carbohydrate kinase family protein [Candidatus Thiodiazotropha taylori]PUB82646.1 MAG: carbohydrate kinase family protein [gamma proteobacterium symbiont of Ctena orbiculata]MBT2995169.1 carbohydrate kinase family protein [Candidatus Thiodiazotropha taylori]MBT2999912.1 carbohydrate kinase family protein [Candidatus Thiodiazotropha taylori]MBT3027922.1 carbohydrate kinase family protein [Candidatus Thiodiazotropha taylori]